MRKEVAGLVEHANPQLRIGDRDVHVEPKDDERAHDVLELDLEHLVTLVLGDLLVFPARERMGARAGDPQSLGLEELGQGVSHLAELVARLVDVFADGGADLDHRLHHLALHLVAQLRCSRRQEGVDMRVELARGVDDLVFLFDTDRQKAVPTHAGSSTTNVGTTLPAPAVTLRSAAAETRVMKPPGRPSNR